MQFNASYGGIKVHMIACPISIGLLSLERCLTLVHLSFLMCFSHGPVVFLHTPPIVNST